jgi:DNA-directed RNA polymerase subunit M/transcription elongation factor TFIIS
MIDKEEFKIMEGMDAVNADMANKIEQSAPICHMRKMIFEQSDSVDGHYTSWWECSYCGHTKEI